MRVLLISANREDVDIRVPALGLACIAAASENAGHETRFLDLMVEQDPPLAVSRILREFRPEAIGVSVRNIDDQRMRNPRFLLDQALDVVTWCKEGSSAQVILGGAGFSILPQPILNYLGADMGIQGEGESTFIELLKRLQAGEKTDGLPGLYRCGSVGSVARTFIKDLDALPLPDPHFLATTLADAVDAPVPVQSRRGCPLACSYCSTPTIEGSSVRRRSPETIVDWMAGWVAEGFRRFYFVDNTFNLPPAYAARVCSKIIDAGLNISWRCILFPGGLTPELIGLMAKAGCNEVSLGFESGSARVLRSMRKQFDLDEVRRASKLLRSQHIRSMGFLLLGGPGETRSSAEESFDFAESLDLDSLRISIGVRIYPHTDVARVAMEKGLISSDQDLLFPRFYIEDGLEDWLYETAVHRMKSRSNWFF